MTSYRILTDSGVDLPPSVRGDEGLKVLQIPVTEEGTEGSTDFYQRMRSGALPVVGTVDTDAFEEMTGRELSEGRDVICLFSGKWFKKEEEPIRKACQRLQEKYPDRQVIAPDILMAAGGGGLLVKEACRRRREGTGGEELIRQIPEIRRNIQQWCLVDQAYYPERAGLLPRGQILHGSALKLKPVLTQNEEGETVIGSQTRGMLKGLSYLAEKVTEETESCFIFHGGCPDRAEKLLTLIREKGFRGEAEISEAGAVTGTYTGPGMCGLAVKIHRD